VKQFWQRVSAAISSEARAAAALRIGESLRKDEAELGKEVLMLQAGTQKTCHDLVAAAREKGMAFAEKWRSMAKVVSPDLSLFVLMLCRKIGTRHSLHRARHCPLLTSARP
jgi:hypothetical protein